MKKTLALILAVITVLTVLSAASCKPETPDDPTKESESAATEPLTDPVTDPAAESAAEPETKPVTEPASEPVTEPATEPVTEPVVGPGYTPLDFVHTFTETWTAGNGRFLDFDDAGGKATVFLAIWNSDGEFPKGDIVFADEGVGTFLFTVRYTAGSTAGTTETFRVTPVTANSFSLESLTGETDFWDGTYQKYIEYQYPDPEAVFEPIPDHPVGPSFSPLDLVHTFTGTWTSKDGRFVDFDDAGDKATVFFAVWNAGGDFPAGEIIAAEQEYDDGMEYPRFTMTVRYTGSGLAGQTERFELTPDSANSFNMKSLNGTGSDGYWNGTFQKYVEYQFPNPEKFFEPIPDHPAEPEFTPLDLVHTFTETWTANNGRFVDFDDAGGKATVFLAVWNAGGDFPAGEIIAATCETLSDPMDLRLTMTVRYTSSVLKGQTETFELETVSVNSFRMKTLTGSDEYWNGTYQKYLEYQFPNPEEYFEPIPDPITPAEFIACCEGTWTAPDGRFLCFHKEGEDCCVRFDVWNSDRGIGEGVIVSADVLGLDYNIWVRRPGKGPDSVQYSKYTVSVNGANSFMLTANESYASETEWNNTYTKYMDYQYPDPLRTWGH